MLKNINSPKDIKKLNIEQLESLADEIRAEIIKTTLANGGHLASNLGAVEITLAMHYVFDAPQDKIIFDVGHQCYTHKLITGRAQSFNSLRKKGGICGFPSHNESEYDTFDAGHSSTAISMALGLARARDIKRESYEVVALVGDGAIGGGMAFEALNDAGTSPNTKVIIVLNDNEMSIAKNVGALSSHFSKLRTKRGYIASKRKVKSALVKINNSGKLFGIVAHLRNTLRYFLIGETIFDAMDITYLGPINGHSVSDLIDIFTRAKESQGPVIIHAVTRKGCGYDKAEGNPEAYHGVSPKKSDSACACDSSKVTPRDFSAELGNTLCQMAREDSSICAITAGMPYNTGLQVFATEFKDRFFDTGIAEPHALSMAGGLAKGGMKPYIVIYSTFLQRGFDQIFHDICLQELPVTICIDHAGLVGEDGATHQGVYDLGFLRSMPNLIVLAPRDCREFNRMLLYAQKAHKPIAIRYPKGKCPLFDGKKPFDAPCWDVISEGEKGTVITFGNSISDGIAVAKELDLSLFDARSLNPLDEELLNSISSKPIVIIEENSAVGGLKQGVLDYYAEKGISAQIFGFSVKNKFVSVGSVLEQKIDNGIDAQSIIEKLRNEIR